MANPLKEINLENSPLTAQYMPRPRIDAILDSATRCQLAYVIAGAGYGKTQAVHHYLKQQEDTIVRWVQLTESDNVGSRFLESLSHGISMDNPDLAEQLRAFGFPETLARFKQFIEIIKTAEHRAPRTILVLDDFHSIHSKPVLAFAERFIHVNIPGSCIVIISRKEPEINAVSLFSRGRASIITEDELCFTNDEFAEFLRGCGIPFSAKDLPKYIYATKGWALAIKLFSLVAKRTPKNLDLALDTMKQNIFKLLETEAWDGFSLSVQKMMVMLSLVSDLPLVALHELTGDKAFLQSILQLASFIWYDSFIGDFRIHPLYLEFLRSKHHVLSSEEEQDTYRQAAKWCSENKFFTDALRFYAKSHQHERMCELLLSYPFRLPSDTCEYFLRILEEMEPEGDEKTSTAFLLLKHFFIPILLVGAGKLEEAESRCYAIIRAWENSKEPYAGNLLYHTYNTLAYIGVYRCTVTHQYDFPAHLRKALEYYNALTIPALEVTGPFAVADIRSYVCVIGEGADYAEFDAFLETTRETAVYIDQTSHYMFYGCDDLTACELAFFKNQLEPAKNYAYDAILKARDKKQYSIEIMAEQYLLRIAMAEGNVSLVNEILKQLQAHLDSPDFWSRQLLYDLITGFFYAHIGFTNMVPAWFHMDEKEMASEIRIPIRELIVKVKHHIACKKYDQTLAVLCKSYPREPHYRYLFGELALSLLTAVARFGAGDAAGAMTELEKAYELSFEGKFEMFFVELGRELSPLIAAALKQADCRIPKVWLKMIGYKASAYRKKLHIIISSIKKEQKIEEPEIKLSNREQELLQDLYIGLSREEICATRFLTMNTVRTIMQSLYIKLGADSNVDAVRIAIEKKLLD